MASSTTVADEVRATLLGGGFCLEELGVIDQAGDEVHVVEARGFLGRVLVEAPTRDAALTLALDEVRSMLGLVSGR